MNPLVLWMHSDQRGGAPRGWDSPLPPSGPGAHLQQLYHEDQRLRLLLQLVQVLVAQRVIGEHVGQPTRVHVPLCGVLALRHLPQAPGQDGVDPCVLGGKTADGVWPVCSELAGPHGAPTLSPATATLPRGCSC